MLHCRRYATHKSKEEQTGGHGREARTARQLIGFSRSHQSHHALLGDRCRVEIETILILLPGHLTKLAPTKNGSDSSLHLAAFCASSSPEHWAWQVFKKQPAAL